MSSESPACLELRAKAPSNWGVESLEKVTDFQEGPGILAKDFRESGVPLLRLRNIDTPRVQLDGCNFLDPAKVNSKWKHFGLSQGDFLISTSASLGRVSVVGPDAVNAIAYTGIIRFRSRSPLLHHEYLRAFLSSRIFVEQAERMATGSVIKHFGPSHLKQMAITLPPLETQIQIAQIFDILDDRITLLRETNTTLEAIAQALFKSWFVDFDPVHAKMQGRAPEGMIDATAALFPDSFEESELEDVPKGWKFGSLSDLCVIASGKRPVDRNDVFSNSCNIPLYGGAGVMGYTSESLFEDKKIVTGRVGTLGRVHVAYPPFWASDNVLVLSPRDETFFSFSFQWLCGIDVHALNRGSTQPLLTQKDLGAQVNVIPPRTLLEKFEEISATLNQQIRLQTLQIETLTNLRETLLPRLISGQLHLDLMGAADGR